MRRLSGLELAPPSPAGVAAIATITTLLMTALNTAVPTRNRRLDQIERITGLVDTIDHEARMLPNSLIRVEANQRPLQRCARRLPRRSLQGLSPARGPRVHERRDAPVAGARQDAREEMRAELTLITG